MSKTEILLMLIPIVIALAAVISPVIVASINNKHQFKTRRLELDYELTKMQQETYYADKKAAFDTLLQKIGQHLTRQSNANSWDEFRSATNSAILFASDENKKLIIEFLNFAEEMRAPLSSKDREKYFDKMTTLATSLNHELFNTYRPVINSDQDCKKQNPDSVHSSN